MKKIQNCDLIEAVRHAKSILVFTHFQPDGDAVGSALALYHLFLGMGKKTNIVCQDVPAEKFRFLPGIEAFHTPETLNDVYEMHLAIDASDLMRLGSCASLYSSGAVTAQIDHHASNDNFALYNEVDAGAAAAGMLAMRLMTDLGESITPQIAACLYTAISTDTGNFCFPSVTGETFEMVGRLCDDGLVIAPIAREIHLMKSAGHMRLLGVALRTLHFFGNARIAGMYLSKSDFSACGATQDDGDGIVNHGLYIPGVQMAYLATEVCDGVKFSLRSIEPATVLPVARRFGGGGHAQACGCLIKSDIQQAITAMEATLVEELNR